MGGGANCKQGDTAKKQQDVKDQLGTLMLVGESGQGFPFHFIFFGYPVLAIFFGYMLIIKALPV